MKYELKVCGLTRKEDCAAAILAGIDVIGVVLVPGSPRFISMETAKELFSGMPEGIRKVCVVQDLPMESIHKIIRNVNPDIIQLHGNESVAFVRELSESIEVWKAVHLKDRRDVELALEYPCEKIVADASRGGSGQTCDWELVAELAGKRSVLIAGGISPDNIVEALEQTGADGADLCSGLEKQPGIKSTEAIRETVRRVKEMNGRTHYGIYGGQYVAETLMNALHELEDAYRNAVQDPKFHEEFQDLMKNYVGRESPLYFAKRLTEYCNGAKIYLKREDLNHTGAHKINNTIGQILLARRMGKKRIIAETGAGMHGVATATVAALFGMECEIFMGEVDIQRQAPNVDRMLTLGAKVRSITEGSATLKDAMNAAIREWTTNPEEIFYLIGTAAGPYPYPEIVRNFQSVIGKEARKQCLEQTGRMPDEVIACVGGGSNAIGIFAGFQKDSGVRLVGVEAGGLGLETGKHAASINGGSVGILHGMKAYLLQDENGQVQEAYSISAGLDYPGVGPEHCHMADTGAAQYVTVTDQEAIEAFDLLSRKEGIIPALESSHAIAYAIRRSRELDPGKILIVNLSGRGDKDMDNIKHYKEGLKNGSSL